MLEPRPLSHPARRLATLGPAIGDLVNPDPERMSPRLRWMWLAIRIGALAAICYGVAAAASGASWHGQGLAVALLTGLAAASWLGWLVSAAIRPSRRALTVCVAALIVSGSILAGMHPVNAALGLCGAGVFVAAFTLMPAAGVVMTAAGTVALVVAGIFTHSSGEPLATEAMALTAITLGGFFRRQYRERLRAAESLVAQTRRAQREQTRSATLSERARIAREIHDVLAHSLGALVLQLDAADALLDAGRSPQQVRQHVKRAHSLAVEGLTETRRAVGALRDGTAPVPEQLAELAFRHEADTGAPVALDMTGNVPARLPPDAALTVFRVAQEALSNARKHAFGAPVTMTFAAEHDGVALTVSNPLAPSGPPLASLIGTGGGYGLAGLVERAELIGGQVSAGPADDEWTVRLWLPA